MGEFDDFDMFEWLLGTNRVDGIAIADGEGNGNGNSDFQQSGNVSSLQISVSQGCSTKLFRDVPVASPLVLQRGLNELGMMESPLSDDVSVLMPDTGGHVEQLLSQEGSSSNLIVDGTSSSGWEFSGRHDGGKQVHQNEAKAIEDASLSGKNDCPRKHRGRNAEKHNEAEKKRRHRFNRRIRTLQSLVPEVDKVDTASVLDKAIVYVKSLQLHVSGMWENANPISTPLGVCTLQSFQHPQSGPMEPRTNGEMPFNDGMPVSSRSLSVPRGMAQSYLSRASSLVPQLHGFPDLPQFHGFPDLPQFHAFSSLPSPAVQMPHAPTVLPFEGFRSPHWLSPAALNVPITLNHHQQLPLHTQEDEGEASNTLLGRSNCGAGSS
ncbi:unnamed protein product [Victoria cruziana]